eukprot:gnl/MRDRNA2_/MRDRNA2_34591_c0_seq1.p1 gnl/MRDRNA2_/MRDRNA2_34591_c0~~gnl/MRDRNA2_/MRDRNA2_34591_c0_seq1.p1  ORF type:complete len:223 (+),score=34.80 gnl/MRDRNA2_/MRDRNA2_34591_c0_seq1:57-725(+)
MNPILFVVGFLVSCGIFAVMFRARLYDILIVKMTERWYRVVLTRLPKGSSVLDVGIGTASALLRNSELLQQKEIHVVGVDYDGDYIAAAKKAIGELGHLVKVQQASVYDLDKSSIGSFDAVYFSGSFSLMPDPVKALDLTGTLLKPNGRIFITQTFQRKAPPFLGTLKPLLKFLTTIDFGKLTSEQDLEEMLKRSEREVVSNEVIEDSVNNMWQAARIVELK